MPAPAPNVALLHGDDDFSVKQRARQFYQEWCAAAGGFDHEIIDAAVNNSGEALRALARLREALQTLPFFGGAKVVWFQNCNFLGDDRTSTSAAVTETLGEIAQELKAFRWDGVRLLISACMVDKRRTFYKTLEKIGSVEGFSALSLNDSKWVVTAEQAASKQLRSLKKSISDEALARLVNHVGPNLRQLTNEVEKLALYTGDRDEIEAADVDAVVTRNKLARAFALGDALGDRDLPRLLRTLDEELWTMQFDRDKSEIGLLYGLIAKVRAMLLAGEMVRAGWLNAKLDFTDRNAYSRFKSQLERVPADAFAKDRKFNPLAMHPFVLFGALRQSANFSADELVRAMELLLDCNRRLVTSQLDESLVLQQTLTQIVRGDTPAPAAAAR
jgi:DNA polymerase-3 subunit delta